MLRIIMGKAKGVRLVSPPGNRCRPTAGRTKEALFSILADRLEGARLLDVFAGSGQIGLEALSRGASEAVFLEKDGQALAAIRENVERTRLKEGFRLLPGDAMSRLKALARQGERFDIIYLDPPWPHAQKLLHEAGQVLADLLEGDGILAIETDGEILPDNLFLPSLSWLRSCQYGTSVLSFYQFKPDPA